MTTWCEVNDLSADQLEEPYRDDLAQGSVIGPRVDVRPIDLNDPADCLRLGLDLLALGCAVQVIKPSGAPVEVLPSNPGALIRMLGGNHPELSIAVKITDRPDPEVLRGAAPPRITARREHIAPATGWPIDKVLGALQDLGIRPRPKGLGRWASFCPAHNRSLSGSPAAHDSLKITERSDGKVSIDCFKKCDWRLILGILGLTPRDVYPGCQQ
jgi:hypothetical protein